MYTHDVVQGETSASGGRWARAPCSGRVAVCADPFRIDGDDGEVEVADAYEELLRVVACWRGPKVGCKIYVLEVRCSYGAQMVMESEKEKKNVATADTSSLG